MDPLAPKCTKNLAREEESRGWVQVNAEGVGDRLCMHNLIWIGEEEEKEEEKEEELTCWEK